MSKKCHFCEHERGPRFDKSEECLVCHNHDKFRVKKRMTQSEIHEYERFKIEEEWINDRSVDYDRETALAVLTALSNRMYPSNDIFGNKTLVIDRHRFEAVRKKFLDGNKEENKNGIHLRED